MAQIIGKEYFRQVLNHEISSLQRIKRALNLFEHIPAVDNVAIALVPYRDKSAVEPIKKSIGGFLRDSDVIFPDDRYALLMLPGTDEMGTIHVLEGISEFLGEGFDFIYAVYPNQGSTSEELLNVLSKLAKSKLGIEPDV